MQSLKIEETTQLRIVLPEYYSLHEFLKEGGFSHESRQNIGEGDALEVIHRNEDGVLSGYARILITSQAVSNCKFKVLTLIDLRTAS